MSKRKGAYNRRTFSLIELLIVVIIIGLLVAGVSGGISLTRNSKIRNIIDEARIYNSAIDNFYIQFNQLPGDADISVKGSATGDKNGKIEYINASSYSESQIALQHMVMANIINSNLDLYVFAVEAGEDLPEQIPGVNIPASIIKNGGWIFDSINNINNIILTGKLSALTNIANLSQNSLGSISGIITPTYALAIDRKIDDGVADKGKVRGLLKSCFFKSTYLTTNSARECVLAFEMSM